MRKTKGYLAGYDYGYKGPSKKRNLSKYFATESWLKGKDDGEDARIGEYRIACEKFNKNKPTTKTKQL